MSASLSILATLARRSSKPASWPVTVTVRASEDEDGADVNVQIPSRVVDALLSGEGEELNFRAAIEALAAEGEGELVTVNDDDDRVRVWVDHIAEAE